MLSEPALALTDLALGATTLVLAQRLAGRSDLPRAWFHTFAWTGVAAVAGFVHHGFVTYSDTLAGPSFAIVSMMVVVAVSYLLSASVHEVLGPGRRVAFWVLRGASLGLYAVLAANGHAGASSILLAESVTMSLILLLWWRGWRAGHPLAPGVIVAFVVTGLAAVVHALPPDRRLVGLDPISWYHLAQIPGIALLYRAISRPGRRTNRRSPAAVFRAAARC